MAETEKFWPGWFQGLSSKFLSSSPAKMLLLAGIDRLDTDLTVGQMQGLLFSIFGSELMCNMVIGNEGSLKSKKEGRGNSFVIVVNELCIAKLSS